jgi:DNA repair protein RecO (recombination protein O)
MPGFSTPAIMIRRTDYGDYDLIVTLFTLKKGKISAIAKSAKKSQKRFSGVLELFSLIDVVCSTGRRKGMPILQEAMLSHPFPEIRRSIKKTAYASYWSELIYTWLEEEKEQTQLYRLFNDVLATLDDGRMPEDQLSILFQMRFMKLSGLRPNLAYCRICQTDLEQFRNQRVVFDLINGGIICGNCPDPKLARAYLSKGTIKQLQWIENGDMARAERLKLSSRAAHEGETFLEAFVPIQLGKTIRSLKVMQKIRG